MSLLPIRTRPKNLLEVGQSLERILVYLTQNHNILQNLIFTGQFVETPNGSLTDFTTSDKFLSGKIFIMRDSSILVQDVHFIVLNSNTIRFISAPFTNEVLRYACVKDTT